ncbi:acyl-CoA dehydrogenase [Rhodococcus erythropolis]|uniref:Dibenzothiophene monooxygenase n=1 Tax=Rhodococcus erythropolis TaxID=1833 RepID=A0A5N5E1L9_RHOER|nr:acyl-CoA dehydrogenase [Rhodococcus erythropolis]
MALTHTAPIHEEPTSVEFSALFDRLRDDASGREVRGENAYEQIKWIKAERFGTITLPTELGGRGYTTRDLLTVVIRLAEADPIVAHVLRAHFWQVKQILRLPDSPQRDRWISAIRRGELFGNASSEQGSIAAGSYDFQTRLEKSSAGTFRLSGTKFYSTGSLFSDWIMVSAKTSGDGVGFVIVPTNRVGVELVDDWDGIGQNRTGTGTTIFRDVEVTEDEIIYLRTLGSGVPAVNDVPLLQLYLNAVIVGILRNTTADAVDLLHSRTRSFDHAPSAVPASDPVLQKVVGELSSTTFAAEATVLAAANAVDQAYASELAGNPAANLFNEASLAGAQAKVHIDKIAIQAASTIFDVGGASSASRAKNLDRHWRNIRTLTLHNPTDYKAIAIGNLLVNGTALPRNGYF